MARPDLIWLAGAVATALAAAFVNVKIPALLGELVNDVAAKASTALMYEKATLMVSLYAIQAGLTASYITLLSFVGERMAERMRNRLFEALSKQDVEFFDRRKIGEISNRLTADVQEFKSSFKQVVSLGLRSGAQILGSLVSMYLVSPSLTGSLIVIVPAVVGVGTYLGGFLRRLSGNSQRAVSDATAVANEVLGNIRTVRAFGQERFEQENFASFTARCRRLNTWLGLGVGLFTAGSNLFINGVVLGVVYYGGTLVQQGQVSPGQLMQFLVSSQTVQRSVAQLSVLIGKAVTASSAGARVFEYMYHPSRIPLSDGKILPAVEGGIEFAGVCFHYPTRPEHQVFSNFNFKIPAGKVVALCGPSGAGKSTVASMVERFYDPNEGAVLLDGHDMRTLDATWLRSKVIGYIDQEPVLFARSVMDNIRYGSPDATDVEVYDAARLANADQFIRSFPDGYETILGERGVTVSGGQRQRIAIARALLKNPQILILDEATSALDAESENLVQSALTHLTKDRTVIVIAHRLSTIQSADQIAVVVGGQVVEMGTHKKLLRRNGVYANLVKHQLSSEGGMVV